MRIAQLIDSLYIGGAEKLQVTFMRTALSRGLQPTLITFNSYPEEHFFQQLKSLGIEIIELRGRSLFDPILLARLIRVLRDGKFDILHTHLTYGIILGGIAGWVTHTPVVASIHNLKPDSWRFFETVALRFLTTRRIAVGSMVAQTHQPRMKSRTIDIVLNPVEPILPLTADVRRNVRSEFGLTVSRLLLITVGRLLEAKGYIDLLDAIHELRKEHPEILLIIVGIGDFEPVIREKIKSLDLDGHVQLLGSRSDVPILLAASDIYVSASHWEGLPVSILEAMAAGLPVVATNVGDIPRVVRPEFGISVPPHQPKQLANALRVLIEDPDQRVRFGVGAREYVAQYHTPDVWLDQLLTIYAQVISSTARHVS
jgi:glycosyltransferase involved in cell wall biosynthesis